MRTQTLHNTLTAAAALTVLAFLPAPARAQFTLTLSTSAVTGLPGNTDLQVLGSLTNLANTPADFVTESFNLLSGPSKADLTTALVFSDDNLTNPQIPLTLGAKQVFPGPTGATFAPLLFLNADPTAPLGLYTGNFSITYGGQTVGRDFTINLAPPSVPEAGTLPILALGVGYIGYILLAVRRRKATPQC